MLRATAFSPLLSSPRLFSALRASAVAFPPPSRAAADNFPQLVQIPHDARSRRTQRPVSSKPHPMKHRRHLITTMTSTRRPRRRLKILAVLLTLVLVLLVAEVVASRMIADKLRRTVEAKLDAHLELGPLVYIPPYGAWTWNARITRGGEDAVFRLARQARAGRVPVQGQADHHLAAARPPAGGQPRAGPVRRHQEAADARTIRCPRKLSGMLRLKHVRVTDGQVTLRRRRPPERRRPCGATSRSTSTRSRRRSRSTRSTSSRAPRRSRRSPPRGRSTSTTGCSTCRARR